MSLIVISEIVGLFVKTLTADDEYSLRSSGILLQPIQMQLSKKQVNFFKFFTQFLRSTSTFSNKKMTLIAFIFLKLLNVNDALK